VRTIGDRRVGSGTPLWRLLIAGPGLAGRPEPRAACERDGFEVVEAARPVSALEVARRVRPHAALLAAAGGHGLDACEALRQVDGLIAIVIVAAGSWPDVANALGRGADEVVSNATRPRELSARIEAVLRRSRERVHTAARGRLVRGDLVIDLDAGRVSRGGRDVRLTATELDLLALLARGAGRTLSREAILERVWAAASSVDVDTRVIDVHIRNLRLKIEPEPSRPHHVLAVPGIGYRLAPPDAGVF
jgi:DNA-binding response OmpR family regulator